MRRDLWHAWILLVLPTTKRKRLKKEKEKDNARPLRIIDRIQNDISFLTFEVVPAAKLYGAVRAKFLLLKRIRGFTRFPVSVCVYSTGPWSGKRRRIVCPESVKPNHGLCEPAAALVISPTDENGGLIRRVNFVTALRGHSCIRTTNPGEAESAARLSTWRVRETDEDFHKLIKSLPSRRRRRLTLPAPRVSAGRSFSQRFYTTVAPVASAVNCAKIWSTRFATAIIPPREISSLPGLAPARIDSDSIWTAVSPRLSIILRYHGPCPPSSGTSDGLVIEPPQ